MYLSRLLFWFCLIVTTGCFAESRGATPTVAGTQVTIIWDPSPDTNQISGYYILSGTASGVYTNQLDVGLTNAATISGLQTNLTYFLVVVAHDGMGLTSPPSNEISFTAATVSSPMIQGITQTSGLLTFNWNNIAGLTYQVQYSSDLLGGNWTDLGNPFTTSNAMATFSDQIGPNLQRFYRVLVIP
jgi:hypothetical protein